MSDLTEQEIVDAIDRALARVEKRFATTRSKPPRSKKGTQEKPVGRQRAKKPLVAAG